MKNLSPEDSCEGEAGRRTFKHTQFLQWQKEGKRWMIVHSLIMHHTKQQGQPLLILLTHLLALEPRTNVLLSVSLDGSH